MKRTLADAFVALLWLLSCGVQASPDLPSTDSSGEPLLLQADKALHLVFTDIWAVYEGRDDAHLNDRLPLSFINSSQRVWVQPNMNVTNAHLRQFVRDYPQMKPLILDDDFSLMRSHQVWSSPYHLVYQAGELAFRGDEAALLAWLSGKPQPAGETTAAAEEDITVAAVVHNAAARPEVGDRAPLFSAADTQGQQQRLTDWLQNGPLHLVFLDALCPMPHFPHCEPFIEQLNQQVKEQPQRQWLAVVNSYYVTAEMVADFRQRYQLQMPLVFDEDRSIFNNYQVFATPYRVQLDAGGQITYRGESLPGKE